MDKVTQYLLEKTTSTGKAFMVTWIPYDPRVKLNQEISLQDSIERWTVRGIYQTQRMDQINQRWGLNLPKSQRTER